jgi:hypothetical protein
MTDRLTIADIRKAGFCVRGSLQHAELLGLDRRLLMREGLPLADVENINDGNVQRSVAVARQRIANGQQ